MYSSAEVLTLFLLCPIQKEFILAFSHSVLCPSWGGYGCVCHYGVCGHM